MSHAPYGLAPCGKLPTGALSAKLSFTLPSFQLYVQFPSQELSLVASHTLPQGKVRPSVPRAAFSHSASVGSLLPAQVQYAVASFQVTRATGCFILSAMSLPAPFGVIHVC